MGIYLNINQQQVGPYEITDLKQMLNDQQVNLGTLAWKPGMNNWEPLSSSSFASLGVNGTKKLETNEINEIQTNPITSENFDNQYAKVVSRSGSFKIGSVLKEAFAFFKANVIGSIAWLILTSIISSTGIGFILAPLFGVNFFACAKKFQETGQKMDLSELFDFSKSVEKILGSIVLGFIIGIGFVFFVIPGIIFSMWWTFSPCVLADNPNLPFTKAMKESRNIAKGNWIKLILLFITLGFLQVLGAICLGIGLLVTIPVGHVALYFAYAQCKK